MINVDARRVLRYAKRAIVDAKYARMRDRIESESRLVTVHRPAGGLVFAARNGSPLDRRNLLNRQLKPTCKKLKLEGVTWHWLWHATATLLNSAGASLGTVQALLGHSSPEITRDVYLHSVPADARRAVQRVEDLIGAKWTQVPAWPEPVTNVTQ
jgi:integrase